MVYDMAQSSSSRNHDDKVESLTGVTAFWQAASLAPPVEWRIWIDNFFLAADLKEGCNTRALMNPPDATVSEPLPKPEDPPSSGSESNQARAEREARNAANLAKVAAINAEIARKGPRLSHRVYYHEVENSMRSRLYFALGKEGIRRFTQKNPKMKIHEKTFRDFVKALEDTFQEEVNVTYERMLLFTRTQKATESLEGFHAALTEQASKCNLGALEGELVKDIFIARMQNEELKLKFIMEKYDEKKVLEEIILYERPHCYQQLQPTSIRLETN